MKNHGSPAHHAKIISHLRKSGPPALTADELAQAKKELDAVGMPPELQDVAIDQLRSMPPAERKLALASGPLNPADLPEAVTA